MATYLQYPVKSLHEAQPYLPDYLNEMRHRFLGEDPVQRTPDTTLRAENSDMLDRALAGLCGDTWSFLILKSTGDDVVEQHSDFEDSGIEAKQVISMLGLRHRVRTTLLCHTEVPISS